MAYPAFCNGGAKRIFYDDDNDNLQLNNLKPTIKNISGGYRSGGIRLKAYDFKDFFA